MDEKEYAVPVLYNEIQNLKQRVAVLEEDSKQDRKEFTIAIKTISESLTRLTTIQEQQSQQIKDVNENIDMLREEMIRNNESNIQWYRNKYDLFLKILIILLLVGWGIKGMSEIIKLINP